MYRGRKVLEVNSKPIRKAEKLAKAKKA